MEEEELKNELKKLEDKFVNEGLYDVTSLSHDTDFATRPPMIFEGADNFVYRNVDYLYAQMDGLYDPELDRYTSVHSGT